jgi:hypothetical protein
MLDYQEMTDEHMEGKMLSLLSRSTTKTHNQTKSGVPTISLETRYDEHYPMQRRYINTPCHACCYAKQLPKLKRAKA